MSEHEKYQLKDYLKFISTDRQILIIEPKGFMSNEVVMALQDEHWEVLGNAIDQFDGKPFVSILDLRNAGVTSSCGQDMAKKAIAHCIEKGMIGSIEVHTSMLTKVTINRMMKSSGSFSKLDRVIVGSLEEAHARAEEMLSEDVGV